MAVFTSPVLDTFDRGGAANQPMGSNWSVYASEGPLTINPRGLYVDRAVSGDIASGTRSNVWNVATFLTVEAFVKVEGAPGFDPVVLWARGSLSPTPIGYASVVTYSGTVATGSSIRTTTAASMIGVGRAIGGVGIGVSTTLPFLVGVRVYDRNDVGGAGVMIETWVRPNGGQWTRVNSALDTSSQQITTAGYVGLGSNQSTGGQAESFNDFGAGSFTPSAFMINSDSMPGYTGPILQPGTENVDLNTQVTAGFAISKTNLSLLGGMRSAGYAPTKNPPLVLLSKPNRTISLPAKLQLMPSTSGGSLGGTSKTEGGGVSVYSR